MTGQICHGAILNDENKIVNILVFETPANMDIFCAVPVSENQHIGDIYIEPERYENLVEIQKIVSIAQKQIAEI